MAVTMVIVAAALAATVYALKKGVNLGWVMLGGSALIAVLSKMPFREAGGYFFKGVFSDKTISVIFLLFFIMMLENIMRTTGMLKQMVDSLKELVGSNRVAAGLMPAVMGLLPSPGGAWFSCPMVDEVTGNKSDIFNKSFINYWFRHIWMDGFFLYPGMIIMSNLIGVSEFDFFLRMLPFMLISILSGVIFGIIFIKKERIARTRGQKENLKLFITSMLPIIILITLYMSLLKFTHFALEVSVGLVVTSLFIIKKFSFNKILETMKKAFPAKFVLIIIGVMVFKETLTGSGVMGGLPALIKAWSISPVILYFVLPFLAGISSGVSLNYITMTIPVLIPLGLLTNPWYPALAFVAGYTGVMVSPLHLCAVMSADYFKQPLGKLLLKSVFAESITLAVAVAAAFFMN